MRNNKQLHIFQTPIYLSLTICGFLTGVFCMPYMLYTFYFYRIYALENYVPPNLDAQATNNTTTAPPSSTFSYATYTGTFSSYSFPYSTEEPDCSDQIRCEDNITNDVPNLLSLVLFIF